MHLYKKVRIIVQDGVMNQIRALEKRIAELEQQLARGQNVDTATFNRITCRELQVISDTGEPLITMIDYDEDFGGPVIKLLDNIGDCLVQLSTDEHGGSIAVRPTQQVNPVDEVSIRVYVDEDRNGYLSVCGADGNDRVILSVAPACLGSAGRVAICGAIDNHERVIIGGDPETDNGSIKLYSDASIETNSLGNEPGNLRIIGAPVRSSRYFDSQRNTLEKIDEILQGEIDEDLRSLLNKRKKNISEILSQAENNDAP